MVPMRVHVKATHVRALWALKKETGLVPGLLDNAI